LASKEETLWKIPEVGGVRIGCNLWLVTGCSVLFGTYFSLDICKKLHVMMARYANPLAIAGKLFGTSIAL